MTWRSGASGESSSLPPLRCRLVGWRAWRVVAIGGALRLHSAVFEQMWPPGRPAVARCARAHAVPDPACECGVYAVREPRRAVRYLVGRDDPGVVHRVLGQVALWGITVEGERGWRAGRADVVRVLVPDARTSGDRVDAPAIAASLAAAYGVPVEVITESDPAALAARFSL